jgi:RNA polymerase sigma-70 factor, ECF subfamily
VTDEFRTRIVEVLPRLRRFAHALTKDRDRGDDLVQETCMRALSRIDQFEAGTKLDSWMYRIAQNIWFDQVRSSKARGTVVELDDGVDAAVDTSILSGPVTDGRRVVEGRLTLDAVNRAMAKLPSDLQVLVALVCVDGRSYQEAAEITESPIGTVMSRLARARRMLHEALGSDGSSAPLVASGGSHARHQ